MNKSSISSVPRPKVIGEDDDDEQTIQDKIDLLIEHKKECAKTGKYVEAKLSDDRITQLKEHLKEVRERLLDGKHNDEKQAISDQLQEEMDNISKKWESTLNAYDDQAKQQLEDLRIKHENEKNKLIDECNKMTENIPLHISSETLKLKKAEEELAKQGKFEEAHLVQIDVQKSIEKDKEASSLILRKKIEAKLTVLDMQHHAEEEAFVTKALENKNVLEKKKNEELDNFNKKYKITINDMQSKQSAEKKQLQKNKNASITMSQALTSKHTVSGKSQLK